MSKQAAKSAATRRAAIEGAIECFLTLGYARTSTVEIAKVAKISRGAMIYYFPTKRKLLEATVDYIIEERIRAYQDDMRKLAASEASRRQTGIDIYWKHLNTRLFTAFHELTVASRTDPELARVMRSATAKFEKAWLRNIKEQFPEWADKGPLLDLAMDLTQFLLEGMALNRLTHDAKRRRTLILEYLKNRLAEIFEAGASGNHDGSVRQFLRSSRA